MTIIGRTGLLLIAATVAMSSAAAADTKQVVQRLKNCGSQASNSFGSHKEYPVLDEGSGYVGFATADQDASGTKLRYSLVNCATRGIVRIEAEYALKNSSQPVGNDLFAFVEALRKQKRLTNEKLFASQAQNQGYKTTVGRIAEYGTPGAQRADCGCLTYYADLMPYEIIN